MIKVAPFLDDKSHYQRWSLNWLFQLAQFPLGPPLAWCPIDAKPLGSLMMTGIATSHVDHAVIRRLSGRPQAGANKVKIPDFIRTTCLITKLL